MKFAAFFPIVVVLFLVCYGTCIAYVKGLKENKENRLKHYQVIILCILFGGPALLISYMFKEIREEDYLYHYAYLICGIVFTVLQILLVALLIVFKVLTF